MEILQALFRDIDETLKVVLAAIGPIFVLLLITQVTMLRMNRKELRAKLRGFFFATVGLLLFLQGVEVAFIPVGEALGYSVAVKWSPWWLVPIGFALGFLATFAEPAVQLLADEVYNTSGGAIPRGLVLWTLAIGVGVSVALAITRTILGIPLWLLLVPGHLVGLALIPFCDKGFVGIAYDSGGAATGPMTVSFIVALALGVAAAFPDRNPVIDGFGLVAFVLLAPILSVLVVGVLYARKRRALDAESERVEQPGV